MKYLLMIYGNREKWESMPAGAWPEAAQADLRCIETIPGEGAVHLRYEAR